MVPISAGTQLFPTRSQQSSEGELADISFAGRVLRHKTLHSSKTAEPTHCCKDQAPSVEHKIKKLQEQGWSSEGTGFLKGTGKRNDQVLLSRSLRGCSRSVVSSFRGNVFQIWRTRIGGMSPS
jgi:hypothetical protein